MQIAGTTTENKAHINFYSFSTLQYSQQHIVCFDVSIRNTKNVRVLATLS